MEHIIDILDEHIEMQKRLAQSTDTIEKLFNSKFEKFKKQCEKHSIWLVNVLYNSDDNKSIGSKPRFSKVDIGWPNIRIKSFEAFEVEYEYSDWEEDVIIRRAWLPIDYLICPAKDEDDWFKNFFKPYASYRAKKAKADAAQKEKKQKEKSDHKKGKEYKEYLRLKEKFES